MRLSFRATLALAVSAAMIPGLAQTANAPTRSLAPRLPDLLRGSALVVLGNVSTISEHDDGRLLQAHLRISQTLSGESATDGVNVVEERRFPSVPPALKAGRRVVAFLEVAPLTSHLRRSLPSEGQYYKLVSDRWGLIELGDSSAERAVSEAVNGWIAIARSEGQDEAQRAAALRRLVFSEVGAQQERLVEDGVAGLGDVASLAGTLTESERDVLIRALKREDLPERVRIALVEAIAQAQLRSLAPALSALPGAGPELVRASAAARARLGAARESSDLVKALGDENRSARLAAVNELIESPAREAVGKVATLALTDPAREVRLAAIEALRKVGSPEALKALGQTFGDKDPEIRRRSAEAIHHIGGRQAAELLAGLAFTAPTEAQRHAVLLLMALGVSRDDPLVVRIRDTHPDPAVRDLAAHGLQMERK